MSLEDEMEVSCPICGYENTCRRWLKVNLDKNPELYEELISGRLFEFTCSSCGTKLHVNYPLIYHDPEHDLMISYVPNGDKDYQEYMLRVCRPVIDLGYNFRIEDDEKALREKALIFREGFDDRTVEILKYIAADSALQKDRTLQILSAYFAKNGDSYKMMFVGNRDFESPLTRTQIEDAHELFSPYYEEITSEYTDDNRMRLKIGASWAGYFLDMLSIDMIAS